MPDESVVSESPSGLPPTVILCMSPSVASVVREVLEHEAASSGWSGRYTEAMELVIEELDRQGVTVVTL